MLINFNMNNNLTNLTVETALWWTKKVKKPFVIIFRGEKLKQMHDEILKWMRMRNSGRGFTVPVPSRAFCITWPLVRLTTAPPSSSPSRITWYEPNLHHFHICKYSFAQVQCCFDCSGPYFAGRVPYHWPQVFIFVSHRFQSQRNNDLYHFSYITAAASNRMSIMKSCRLASAINMSPLDARQLAQWRDM